MRERDCCTAVKETIMHTGPEELDALRDEAVAALAAWGADPGGWRIVGAVPGSLGSELRPVIVIGDERYLLRRQPPDLDEDDARFRHSFMRHLRAEGLPVPLLRPRPDGSTAAVIAGDLYELQEWRTGAAYQPEAANASAMLAAAAATLGALHQASAQFVVAPHRWPEGRGPLAVAQTYVDLLRRASEREDFGPAVAAALARVAVGAGERIAAAAQSLETAPGPPELHIHGDYQMHNLAFAEPGVVAIYDFDAARWARRLDELAYALLCFAGLRDDPESGPAPMVDDGLDVLRAHAFLQAYGRVAPPAEGEALLLGDALALVFPVMLANGVVEDLVFADDYDELPPQQDVLPRLEWADAFWLWLERYRDVLAEAWASAGLA
jgi:Ser/Thr protein kinase RdoA (MazF antagonist)